MGMSEPLITFCKGRSDLAANFMYSITICCSDGYCVFFRLSLHWKGKDQTQNFLECPLS